MTAGASPERDRRGDRLLAPAYAATTIGTFALVALAAFEALAVNTVMPTVARELDGVHLFAVAFAAPLATGVIGMVGAGLWCDRRGPTAPLAVALVCFAAGLLGCGLAGSMEVFVIGRVLQGLGGGGITVALYVLVGLVFPRRLLAVIFANFAAAWVLPGLVGPSIAALIATTVGWRWVFLGVVGLVALSWLLLLPATRGLTAPAHPPAMEWARLSWAAIGAVAILGVELLGSSRGAWMLLAAGAFVVVAVALARLTPRGTLRAAAGLPAVIAARGLIAGAFFSTEAYVVFALQEHWGLSPARAGLALTLVALFWALASQAQGRLGAGLPDRTVIRVGTLLVLGGITGFAATLLLSGPAALAMGCYVFAGSGMGLCYPRFGAVVIGSSSERDRGSNSSALSIADSMGAALVIALCGVAFAAADRVGIDHFAAVNAVDIVVAALAAWSAARIGAGSPQ